MAASLTFNSRHSFRTFVKFKVYSSLRKFSKDLVCVSKRDNLHLIAINRPEKRNCVNGNTAIQLKAAFQDFESDQNASVAILHGTGGTFCAGYDLKEVAAGNKIDLSINDGPMGPTRMKITKPVIAAVDGHAVAGGFELALWCDLRVVEETATMGVFCRRFGVPLIDGGTVRLPRLIGLARALDLILTGRGISGKEASEMGLVTKLCKKGEALQSAISLANDIAKFPQKGMNVDKNSTKEVVYDAHSLEEAFKIEINRAIPVLKDASLGASKFFGQSKLKNSPEDTNKH
ncbi:enoyl-CoA hydratase EchA19-like [Uloborus diversus]|uniref:enoyl-CoA hydratase EchA19-like n=1 Tax=Uloborus diversus TaxID=327109 RepID=UPI00240A1960|nr:enoyl-CoA hydratase EchA19-like [Uloborus diversus]